MEKIKFKQIVMKGNPISEEYAKLSRESFECVSDVIEIEQFDAITPESPEYDSHQSKYNWQRSLMRMDNRSTQDKESYDHPHSPSERAGMCSHWELLRQRSETDERFYVIEHDTYLWPQHEETFRGLLDTVYELDHEYVNIGLYMGCYSVSREFATVAIDLLEDQNFPINGGPYGVMERLFKTYVSAHYSKKQGYITRPELFIHPWASCDRLRHGKTREKMFETFNKHPVQVFPDLPDTSWKPNPTTQMIKKDLKVTQDHREYPDIYREKPWTRSNKFKVID
jgi:hypothetical protein